MFGKVSPALSPSSKFISGRNSKMEPISSNKLENSQLNSQPINETPQSKIQSLAEEQKPTGKVDRMENYLCLCKKCAAHPDCEKSALKICTNSLCGYPMYSCLLFIVLLAALIIAFACLLTALLTFNYQNKTYFAKCSSSIDCDISLGLKCSFENGACNCPTRNTYARCDCNKGYFWNGTKCTALLNYLDTGCAHDYNCDSSKGLVCIDDTCSCAKPKVWVNTTQTCDYNYAGCFTESTTSVAFTSQNNVTRMDYFVEICIDFCNLNKAKFAATAISINIFCYCLTTNSGTPSTACNALCYGSSGYDYFCGTKFYNSTSIKAIYSIN